MKSGPQQSKEWYARRARIIHMMRAQGDYKLRELAYWFGISVERVRQIYMKEEYRRKWEWHNREYRDLERRLMELNRLRRPLERASQYLGRIEWNRP